MTFAQIVQAICDHCNLTSGEAQTRVGKAVNRHHKRITSSLGLDASRFVTRSATTTVGVQTVTFSEIEKVDRVIDTTDSTSIRMLEEVSLHEIRSTQPGDGQPDVWCLQNTDADSVTIRLDTVPQEVYSLQADGWTTLSDLAGTEEPVIPESFHDILTWFVIAEELLKKEKDKLAIAFEQKAEKLLSDLRFHLADSPTKDTRQGDGVRSSSGSGGTGSGGGNSGGTSYTQSGLLTFDRGAGNAPYAVAQATAAVVTNLDADKLDGSHLSQVITAATLAAEAAIIPIDLASEVTGRLPFANMVQLGANELAGRRSGSAGDQEPISLGTGLSMSGQTLNADPTIPTGAASEVQFRDGGSFGGDSAFTYNKASDTLTVPLLDISAAAGGQITFPATQNPSINANTLDDYEEGSWTPTITGSGGSSGQAYTTQVGRYIKVGKQVSCWGRVTLSTLGTVTTNVQIGGLPFTAENVASLYGDCHFNWWNALTSTFVYLAGQIIANTTAVTLVGTTTAATGLGTLAQADLSNTSDFIFKISYQASA